MCNKYIVLCADECHPEKSLEDAQARAKELSIEQETPAMIFSLCEVIESYTAFNSLTPAQYESKYKEIKSEIPSSAPVGVAQPEGIPSPGGNKD